jgi:flavoprotein
LRNPTISTNQRIAWGLTGSGHYLRECLAILRELENVDVYLSRAAQEVLGMYELSVEDLGPGIRVFHDRTASAVPVQFFYQQRYHTLVVAPATSNTIAKMAVGISDTLVTNIYAQAGKCQVPSIVFACDTAPELESEAPRGTVMVYPRKIEFDNIARLATFERTTVVEDMAALEAAIAAQLRCANAGSF